MKKVLFITNRNILTTSGELRLIKNRAEALFSLFGIATDFWVWQKKERIVSSNREQIKAGGALKTYVLSTNNPFKTISTFSKIKKDLKLALQKNEYSAVVLSGSGMAKLSKTVKRNSKAKVIFDIHGASEDIVELTKEMSFKRRMVSKIVYKTEINSFKKNFKYVDGCFAVTNALAEYLTTRYRIPKTNRFYIVPCATNVVSFDKNIYAESRRFYRNYFGLSSDEIVLVYSGGVSSWQCIGETLNLYRSIKERCQKKVRLCMFSHQIEYIKTIAKDDKDIIFGSFKPDELKQVLCAGDFAIMLRTNCVTNNVAFPNKFLEYVASGMGIIATPYVYDIANQIIDNKLGFLFDNKNIDELVQYVSDFDNVNSKNNIDKIEQTLSFNGFSNTLKSFVEDLKNE